MSSNGQIVNAIKVPGLTITPHYLQRLVNTAERHQDLTPEVAAAHIFAAVEDIAAQVSALHAALEGRAFARVDPDGIVTWHAPSDTLGT